MSEMTQLPLPGGNTPPDWIHLLPAGTFPAVGGSKVLRTTDLSAVVNASMKAGKLMVDENHSTDLAAPRGKGSPAMGWIEQMEVRQDGIWGQVRWTKRGRTAMEDHAYRAISPVLVSEPDGTVTQILRAALTNNPDLSLKTLHSRTTQEGRVMTFLPAVLRSHPGRSADANEGAIKTALDNAHAAITPLHSADATRLQSQLARFDLANGSSTVPSEQIRAGQLAAMAWLRDVVAGKATLDAVAVVDQSDDWSRYQSRPQFHSRGGSIL